MIRVSFKAAKALKEAGYPQATYGFSYSQNGEQLYGAITENEYYAPTYFDVWLWLWREKDIQIAVWKSGIRVFSQCKNIDPEEAIVSVIESCNWKESIDEKELDRLANKFMEEIGWGDCDNSLDSYVDGFKAGKAGYSKAMGL